MISAQIVDYWGSASDYIVTAGDDVEPQWSLPSNVLTFLQAYNDNNSYGAPLYDFGFLNAGADGSGLCDAYPNTWTSTDFYDVTWGDPYDWPYLEVYDGTANGNTGCNDWGNQNAQLDVYSNEWTEMGVLTENTSGTLAPAQAYTDQETSLSNYALTTGIEFNSNMQPLS